MTTKREKSKTQTPQQNRQHEVIEVEQKPNSNQSIALEAGKFCLDIAKLVFGGVILAGIMQQGIEFTHCSLLVCQLFFCSLYLAFI